MFPASRRCYGAAVQVPTERCLPMLADLLKTAQHHHEAGRLAEAARACRQALDLAPPAGTLLVIGQVGAQAGDWDLAADAFGALLLVRPDDPDILLEYG